MAKVVGFGDDGCLSETELDTEKLISEKNRKNKKSGGFQSMGLSSAVYKGIIKKGYKIPTPIQRKCIGLIKAGGDVVAMARTGSGKTAAFLIPLYEKLKVHSSQTGARALIFSPTRELAVQTGRFCRELGKFTNLRSALILGGDRIEDQFSAIHDNPDILIATPGRFLHIVVEMNLKLQSINYVVFDEADRLFEMGLQEQLIEILKRLPEHRQTLLFSATLPKSLVEFARVGLSEPTLVRLDVENKLNEQLKCAFIGCKSDEKLALLIHLLQNVIKPEEQTVVFAPTRHHVEYLTMILDRADIPNTCVYSSLDAVARKINVAKFQNKKCGILVVTDLAARGIDIPILDNVINFNFPAKAKLFVHRVGRVARAGRLGCAYSLVSSEEVPFLIDLHLFLGEPLRFVSMYDKVSDWNKMYGVIPPSILSEIEEDMHSWHLESVDMENMARVSKNAYKQYLQSRPQPSAESITRSKEESFKEIGYHPIFESEEQGDNVKLQFLNAIKGYKPSSTIFEIGRSAKTNCSVIMKKQRDMNAKAIQSHKFKKKTQEKVLEPVAAGETAEEGEIQDAFTSVISGAPRSLGYVKKDRKRKEREVKDTKNYLSYTPSDYHSEKGLGLGNMFAKEAQSAVVDFTADEVNDLKKQKSKKKWDRKKMKFVTDDSAKDKKTKKIKTESGTWINASYKTNLYEKWMQKKNMGFKDDDGEEKTNAQGRRFGRHKGRFSNKSKDAAGADKGGRVRSELKNKDQILKSRKKEEALKKRKEFMSKRRTLNSAKRKGGSSKGKKRR